MQQVSLVPPPVALPQLPEVPQLPPIDRKLLTPCYFDLLPDLPDSALVADLIRNTLANHVKYQTCYKRQVDLINEVNLRMKP